MISPTPHPDMHKVRDTRLLAVLRAPSHASALRAIDTLVSHGVLGIEVTFSTPDATRVISDARSTHSKDVFIGAGTVTTADQARAAADAGAEFLVSPGTIPAVTHAMRETGRLTMTGALTPTEVLVAQELGVHVVKVFPGSLGGPAFLRALRGPFPDISFMPTGGVSPENLGEWFSAGALAVGAGGDLVPAAALAEDDMDEIARRAQKFVAALAALTEKEAQK